MVEFHITVFKMKGHEEVENENSYFFFFFFYITFTLRSLLSRSAYRTWRCSLGIKQPMLPILTKSYYLSFFFLFGNLNFHRTEAQLNCLIIQFNKCSLRASHSCLSKRSRKIYPCPIMKHWASFSDFSSPGIWEPTKAMKWNLSLGISAVLRHSGHPKTLQFTFS